MTIEVRTLNANVVDLKRPGHNRITATQKDAAAAKNPVIP
jgi:hypothetical protein